MITANQIASKKRPRKLKSWKAQKVRFLDCRLREIRRSLGLTLRDVAKCGVSLATINRAEHGFEVELSHALMLAKFFEKAVEEIWSGAEKKA